MTAMPELPDPPGPPLPAWRVLDMSQAISGPYAARMLADLGADVVRVDGPRTDVTEYFGVVRDGRAGMFAQMNAGKRSVAVDLSVAGATRLIIDLARQADVLIENFRPGVMDRLGLGYRQLSAVNPALIMLSVSGFGPDGPDAQRRALAPVIHAESGLLARQAELDERRPSRPPARPRRHADRAARDDRPAGGAASASRHRAGPAHRPQHAGGGRDQR